MRPWQAPDPTQRRNELPRSLRGFRCIWKKSSESVIALLNLLLHSLLLQYFEPLVDDVWRWKSSVVVGKVTDFNARTLKHVDLIVWLANANHRRNIVLLQLLKSQKKIFRKFWPWKRSSTSDGQSRQFFCARASRSNYREECEWSGIKI